MSKTLKYTLFQRRYTSGQEAHKKVLKIISHQGNKNQSRNGKSSQPLEWFIIKRKRTISNADQDEEKLELLYIADKNVKWFNCFENQFGDSSKS